MRIFLAILLSDNVRESLAQISDDLRRCGSNVTWVKEDNFHVTLFFFGDVEPDICEQIVKAMPKMVANSAPFQLSLEKLGAFPNLRRPRVLWAGVNQGSREIIQVHRQVLSVIEEMGFRDDKKFSPHVTMGRVRAQGNLDKLLSAIEEFNRGDITIGEDFIRGISLIESTLTPKGSVYSELAFVKMKQ